MPYMFYAFGYMKHVKWNSKLMLYNTYKIEYFYLKENNALNENFILPMFKENDMHLNKYNGK